MLQSHKYLPIITARGGSKGIIGKNIADLNGKPLIVYTIESFKKSNVGGDCFVTTDCEKIAAISEQAGAKIIYRPPEISGDSASSASAVIHVIDTLKSSGACNYTDFILLQPTSPLRSAKDIDNAIALYETGKGNSVVSMAEVESHPYKYFKAVGNSVEPLFGQEYLAMPRQQLPKVLKQNGAIYIGSIERFLEKEDFCSPPTIPYIMGPESSIDIDTLLDLELTKLILSR